MTRLLLPLTLAMTAMLLTDPASRGDEGMWLLNDPPRRLLADKYRFEITPAWLEHAQKASVRFNNGGSGSFVSPDGLVLTNHHIGADSILKVSPPGRDLHRDGFLARSRADEIKCPDLELNVLQSIEDVTDRITAAVPANLDPAQAFAARRAALAAVEKESLDKTGLRSDVVTLYQGALYHLYRYKKYTDVRLVFAPEHAVAFFGGDTDNFEFPRWNLDVCFFRVYENDRPARTDHFLRWSARGPAEGDLVFVTGHPGTTNRLETLEKLLHRRDVTLPCSLARLRAMEAVLAQFAERGPDEARQAANDLHRVANARKALSGQYQGLLDPRILDRKRAEQQSLAASDKLDEPTRAAVRESLAKIAEAQTRLATFERQYALLERGDAFFSELFTIARHVLRLPTELTRPSSDRLREYRDSNLESLRYQLYSPAPIHAPVERAKLAASLTFLAEQLGGGHPLVQRVLAGQTPQVRAAQLVAGTRLADPAERKRLVEAGVAAVQAADDPMLQLARLVDDDARAVRKRQETEVEEVEQQAYARLARARFQALGRSVAPDATFSLRLAFGVVKGYREEGRDVPYATTFAGIFDRAERQGHRPPFQLPPRWRERKDALDLTTPFNFVSTADTIGGNSGSPVLNRAGELVGVNFDRNRHGLVRNFVYTEEQARHIAVHSRGILEALRRLYEADELVKELAPR